LIVIGSLNSIISTLAFLEVLSYLAIIPAAFERYRLESG
jgi:hypothetical protein